MASRKARRSSILKTRYDAGSEDANLESGGGPTRNLTGPVSSRRVSFSQTNHVKEFEIPNSSTEDSQSQITEFNQTMCDMNMSVSMIQDDDDGGHEKENQSERDRGQTSCLGGHDISMYQGVPSGEFFSTPGEHCGITMCDLNMSTAIPNQSHETDWGQEKSNKSGWEVNKTRIGTADMSVYQDIPQIRSTGRQSLGVTMCDMNISMGIPQEDDRCDEITNNKSVCHANKTRIGTAGMSVYQDVPQIYSTGRKSLGVTMCDMNISMGISQEDDRCDELTNKSGWHANKTRIGTADMSVYQDVPQIYSTGRKSLGVTMCDMNISMGIAQENDRGDDISNKSAWNANKTRIGTADMSVYQDVPDEILSNNREKHGVTMCNMNMTATILQEDDGNGNHEKETVGWDGNKSSVGAPDMFVYHSAPMDGVASTGEMLGVTTSEMNLSLDTPHGGDRSHYVNKTSVGTTDMTVYQDVPDTHSNSNPQENFEVTMFDMSTAMLPESHWNHEKANKSGRDVNKSRTGTADLSSYQGVPQEVISNSRENLGVTMQDMNLSRDIPNQGDRSHYVNKTSVGYTDMSMYQDVPQIHSKTRENFGITMCDMNLSTTIAPVDDENHRQEKVRWDGNKTNVGAAEMSVYHDHNEPNVINATTREKLGVTMCDMNMTFKAHGDGHGNCQKEYNSDRVSSKTNDVGANDMSEYQETTNEIVSTSSNGDNAGGTQLYFGTTDPQQFRNPFGHGKPMARTRMGQHRQKEQSLEKLSFGKFGSAKTPKRNKIAAVVPQTGFVNKPISHTKAINEMLVQTSPMLTREIGLNCTIANGGKEVMDASMMTSPIVFYTQPISSHLENAKPPNINCVSFGTSPMVTVTPKKKMSLVANTAADADSSKESVPEVHTSTFLPTVNDRTTTADSGRDCAPRIPTPTPAPIVPVENKGESTRTADSGKECAPEVHTSSFLQNGPVDDKTTSADSGKVSAPRIPTPRSSPIVPVENKAQATADNGKECTPVRTPELLPVMPLENEAEASVCGKGCTPCVPKSSPELPPVVPLENEAEANKIESSKNCASPVPTTALSPSPIAPVENEAATKTDNSKQCTPPASTLALSPIVPVQSEVAITAESRKQDATIIMASPRTEELFSTPLHNFAEVMVEETPNQSLVASTIAVNKSYVVEKINPEDILKNQVTFPKGEEEMSPPGRHAATDMLVINKVAGNQKMMDSCAAFDYLETDGGGIDDVEMSFGDHLTEEEQSVKTVETLRTSSLSQSYGFASKAFDDNSFQRVSEKTQDVLVEETCYFEQTLPQMTGNVTQSLLETTQKSQERVVVTRPGSSSGFMELKENLDSYAQDVATLDIYEKWGFLVSLMNELAKLTEDEWQEILKSETRKEFLGENYIKAVNIERNRLNDPHPLYRGAMKRLAELKGTNS